MQAQTATQPQFINTITHGDCIKVMRQMPANSVDFILTDPPYLVNYRDRDGRTNCFIHILKVSRLWLLWIVQHRRLLCRKPV